MPDHYCLLVGKDGPSRQGRMGNAKRQCRGGHPIPRTRSDGLRVRVEQLTLYEDHDLFSVRKRRYFRQKQVGF